MTSEIARLDHADISQLLQPNGARRHPMHGFDEEFVDIVDYIVRITHRIWEDKQVNLIYDYYSHNCVVYGSRGKSVGREAVVAATVQTMHAFPDRRPYADAVIWGGDDQHGFYSSHRLMGTGHHYGYSSYGPPTGKLIYWRTVADCFVRENRIVEEWIVRDELSVVRQMGLDPRAVARTVAKSLPRAFFDEIVPLVERHTSSVLPAPLEPQGDPQQPGEQLRQLIHQLWNARAFGLIFERFATGYRFHGPSGRELVGRDEYLQYMLSLLAAFPNGRLLIEHVCATGDERSGYNVALRWTLLGTHEGFGIYGSPTGRHVRVLGMSHFHVQGGVLQEEWTVFDELALLAQLVVE
jgi:predicted ester cyclase